ncbi:probable terpene synthase 2 [Manihot esculenta]|nr:probable terpene synthase 2 [Manihot esculenta]
MASPVSAVPSITRPLANFHPNIWGDHFLSYASHESMKIDNDVEERVEKLKQEVQRMMLVASADGPSHVLNLVDLIQRLGVSYHFENEITEALQQSFMDDSGTYDDELHNVALRFRLLRQQGFNVSCDVFNKFRDIEGKFNEKLKDDVEGMLSLYEAAYLRVHGEDILEEALAFTTTHLQSIASSDSHLSSRHVALVKRALKQPLRKGLSRLEARHYISIYEEDVSHDKTLLMFAKMDFNILQKLHQQELRRISEWWKNLNFTTKLPFIRDRVVEGYFWILGVYYEPQFSFARWFLTKVFSIASVIDDMYDAYGTLEELEVFTHAVERWDIKYIDQLPQYMKLVYKTLLNIYEEIERELIKQGRPILFHYVKKEMKRLVQAYLVEAKWLNKNYTPTVDEYMSNALLSCGYSLLTISVFVGMGDIATTEAFDWASKDPKILRAASMIGRLMDDIVSHEFEQKRGHVASAIECYMKQNDISEQEARVEFNKQIVDAWKDINEECLRPSNIPMPLLTRVINLACFVDYFYKDGDEYTHVGELMKSSITSILIDSVKIP